MTAVRVRPAQGSSPVRMPQSKAPVAEAAPSGLPRYHKLMLFLMPPLVGLGPWASLTPGAEFSPYAFRIVLVLALVPGFAGLRASFRDAPPRIRTAVWCTVGLVVWGLVSLLWSEDAVFGLRVQISLLLGLLSLVVMLGLCRGTDEGVGALRWGYVAALMATGAVGLWEVATGSHLADATGDDSAYVFSASAISSTLNNPNNFGAFILATLGSVLAMFSLRRGVFSLTFLLGMLALAGFLAVNTESRGAVFGYLVILAVALFALLLFDVGYFLTAGVGLSVLGLAVYTLLPQRVQNVVETVTTEGDQRSDELRRNLSADAWRYFEQSGYLGLGAGSFQAHLANDPTRLATKVTPAHNTLFQTAAEHGLPGVVLLVTIFAACLSILVMRAHGFRQRLAQFEVLLLMAAVAMLMFVASYVLNHAEFWVHIAFMLCLVWNFWRHRGDAAVSSNHERLPA